jgi:hypothetical protein
MRVELAKTFSQFFYCLLIETDSWAVCNLRLQVEREANMNGNLRKNGELVSDSS